MNYLYNGVELPALPEWDRQTYPYAVIFMNDSGKADLYASSIPQYLTTTDEGVAQSFKESGKMLSFFDGYDGSLWGNSVRLTVSNGIYQNMINGTKGIWANYNVYTADGTLYLAASDPIPVGTAFPSDFDPWSWEIGRLVGQAVRRLRGKVKLMTLFEGNITTAITSENHQYATYSFYGDDVPENIVDVSKWANLQNGDTVRLTIDGASKLYSASVTDNLVMLIIKVGNGGLSGNLSGNLGYDDDGFDLDFALHLEKSGGVYSVVNFISFYTRTEGAHAIKMEKVVSS